ncbi:MAG: beta-lactamase family protein [Gemmatimonadales bacterium]|nr:beta-lactamase family protein [Gemmatimonadales bacterium]
MLATIRRTAFFLLFPAVLTAQAPPPVATVQRIADSLARDFVASGGAPSVAVGLVRGNDTILLAAFGKSDLENDVAATARSVYRIGSVTKQFTSSAVMQLVEQGKVKLDDSIGTYLTTLPAAWRGIAVRLLLNHTSGIPSYTNLGDAWRKRWGEEMTPDTIITMVATKAMDFPAGTKWAYNNSGYTILGMLIEKITGHTWADDIESRFAKPLGLTDTRNCPTEALIPRRVHGYEKNENGTWGNTPFLAMTQPYAAGAMCSTVGDMIRWNRALHTGKVLSPASYAAMITPEGAANATPRYGFGLMRDSIAGRDAVLHGGGIHGFITANAWVPSAELSVTVLTNSGSAPSGTLMVKLARAALGVPLETPVVARSLPAAQRAQYLGVYALELPGGARDFTVTADSVGIVGQLVGQGPINLLWYGDNVFGASFDPTLRITFTVEGDRATSMTLVQQGSRFAARRK